MGHAIHHPVRPRSRSKNYFSPQKGSRLVFMHEFKCRHPPLSFTEHAKLPAEVQTVYAHISAPLELGLLVRAPQGAQPFGNLPPYSTYRPSGRVLPQRPVRPPSAPCRFEPETPETGALHYSHCSHSPTGISQGDCAELKHRLPVGPSRIPSPLTHRPLPASLSLSCYGDTLRNKPAL